jgi:hypothetical protein
MFAITLRLFVGGIGRVSTAYAGRDVVGKADLDGPAGVGAGVEAAAWKKAS